MGKLWRITDGSNILTSQLGAAWSPGQNLRESNAGGVPPSAKPFPGAAGLARCVSVPKLGVAAAATVDRGTLCASVAGARLQQDGDIFGLFGGEVRPKARLCLKRQKPEPSSSQLLRHADIPGASQEEVPAHAITRPVRSAPRKPRASPWGSDPHSQQQETKELHLFIRANASRALAKGVRDGQDLLVASRPMTQVSRSCPLLCQPVLPPSRLSTSATLKGRKGEPALQREE